MKKKGYYMEFRLAVKEDIAELKLLDSISADIDAINGQKFFVLNNNELIDYYLEQKGIIIAEQENRIVGYILTQILEYVHGIRKAIWIEHIGTHPEYRNKKVALNLLEYTQNYYRSKADCLYGEIHPLNENSIQLFRKFDCEFVERKLIFKNF
jgi:ribosomal protein S18 acetylase RimI-like enzyme